MLPGITVFPVLIWLLRFCLVPHGASIIRVVAAARYIGCRRDSWNVPGKRLLPLPLGEVAERSEVGEGQR